MNQVTKHRIVKNRIELTPLQTMGHYSFALFPLMFPAMELYFQITNQQMVNSFSIFAIIICFCLSGLIIFLKHKELISERLYESRTNEQFKDAVFATANKMKWNIEGLDDKNIKAIATNFWTSRDWSRISIKREPKYIEIKSVFDMFISVPDIFGINKKHRRTFLRNYIMSNQINDLNDRVIEEIKIKEEEIENEPEWNMKNTLKRLIAYIFSLAFLGLGLAIWKYEGFMYMVPIFIILGSFYIIIDIYAMYMKSKRASS